MAACDNLYGTPKKWKQLYQFLQNEKPEYLIYMKEKPKGHKTVRICYIADIQKWLIENCPLIWVQKELNVNFSIQRFILGKAHHENN